MALSVSATENVPPPSLEVQKALLQVPATNLQEGVALFCLRSRGTETVLGPERNVHCAYDMHVCTWACTRLCLQVCCCWGARGGAHLGLLVLKREPSLLELRDPAQVKVGIGSSTLVPVNAREGRSDMLSGWDTCVYRWVPVG